MEVHIPDCVRFIMRNHHHFGFRTAAVISLFGCGAGGNVITFVMEYENMTFLEAVKMLGERAGVALPQTSMSEEDRKERGIRDRLLEINKIAATYYYRQLRSENGKAGLDYLKSVNCLTVQLTALDWGMQHSQQVICTSC